jgi:hypothetical protein
MVPELTTAKTISGIFQISAIIDDEEEECLQYLNKLEVEEFEVMH